MRACDAKHLKELRIQIIDGHIGFRTLETTGIENTRILRQRIGFAPLGKIVKQIQIRGRSAHQHHRLAVCHRLIKELFHTSEVQTILMEEEAAALAAALLHRTRQITGQRTIMIHLPGRGEHRDTHALTVRHDEMTERADHRRIPHLKIRMIVASTLTRMRSAAGHEHCLAIIFRHRSERQHLEPIHRHRRNIHPIRQHLRSHPTRHAIRAILHVMGKLESENLMCERVERLIRSDLATILFDELKHVCLDFLRVGTQRH